MRTRLNSTSLAALILALAAAACGGGTTVTELGGPAPARCLTSFATPSPTVPAEGGTATVTISAERECTWNARGDSGWLQVSPTSGQGESAVTVTVGANPQPSPRSTDLIVNDQRLSVRQEPAPCVYQLSSRAATVPAAGGRVPVGVSALSGCAWTASSPQPWVRFLAANGSGTAEVTLTVDANPGAARSAQLTIAGESFTLTQSAVSSPAPAPGPAPTPPAPAPPPAPPAPSPDPSPAPPPAPPAPPPPADCSYTIDPRVVTVGSKARNGEIEVRTSSGCAWTAESNARWISITSAASDTGNGKVKYRIQENDGRLDRLGTMRVAGQSVLVYQRGGRDGDDDGDD